LQTTRDTNLRRKVFAPMSHGHLREIRTLVRPRIVGRERKLY